MKIIAAIQARMGSSRFPGKVLADLCGKPVLQHVFDQAKKINVDDVFLLTSKSGNYDIVDLADKNLIRSYIFERDLECLYWYYRCGIENKADYIMRICGDSPFVDYDLANLLIEFVSPEYDYISLSVDKVPAIMTVYGIFVEIISVKTLSAMFEHVSIQFYSSMSRCIRGWHMPEKYKLSIDYQADLKRAELVIDINGGTIPGHKEINNIIANNQELAFTGCMTQNYNW